MIKKVFIQIGLWVLAFIITVASAVYQRKTGPTYPITDTQKWGDLHVSYELLRSHGGTGDQPVKISVSDSAVQGDLVYRRYNTNDNWTRVKMDRTADTLSAALPHQPPAGKLEYHIELFNQNETCMIPDKENVVTRFKGQVPGRVLLPHILFIFLGMLFSTRTAIEAFRKDGKTKWLSIFTLLLLLLGGMIFGPIVQKYAFGAYWTGFPYGTDLTDNKTLIAFIAWIIAVGLILGKKKSRIAVIGAAIVTFVVFLIPHSMHGSELDYSKIDAKAVQSDSLVNRNPDM